jgi:hypothetical protein
MAESEDDALAELCCVRCGRPVIRSLDAYNVFEKMHWVCFHYEFEHGDYDVDAACRDPACPSRMIDEAPPTDWLTEHGITR